VKILEAEIVLCYDDSESAKAVAEAVSPDNFKVPVGLTVKTVRRRNVVSTTVKCRKQFQTLIATIDDLLFSFSIAEKTLKTLKKVE